MFKASFSGLSADDLEAEEKFYGETLGLEVKKDSMGLHVVLPDKHEVFIYQKDDHEPASYTSLNFIVKDLDETVGSLTAKGVEFEQYDWGENGKTDENGIMRSDSSDGPPAIAWMRDPSGNFIALIEE